MRSGPKRRSLLHPVKQGVFRIFGGGVCFDDLDIDRLPAPRITLRGLKFLKKKYPHKIIGFTCGAFDLLHAGHALMLREAKSQCDILVVGLQTDPSLDRPEKHRPIQTIKEREIVLSSIRFVDYIWLYSREKELYQFLKRAPIDVRILGQDWQGKPFTGYDLPIKVYFNSRSHSFSTSELRRRVYEAEKNLLKNT